MSAPTVWILVHQLDAGGAPAVLVRYLRWLASERGPGAAERPEVHVIALADGRHAPAVASLTESCTVLGPATGRSRSATIALAAGELGLPAAGARFHHAWLRRRVGHLPSPDVVLVHGAGAWRAWRALAPAAGRARLVLHLHELAIGIGRSVPAEERGALVAEPDALAAVCEPDEGVAELLGARRGELLVVPSCADAPVALAAGGGGGPQVVGVGEAGWRKGSDRFEALAHDLARRRPDVAVRWIGVPPPVGWELARPEPGPVRWEGEHPDPWSGVGPDALVVLPSREDPLPLVALEAGARGLAVVGSGTGGLAPLLAGGRGWFVEGRDPAALGAAVDEALADPTEAARRGRALQAEVVASLRPEAVGPRWLAAVLGDAGT
ncbi:MAG: glycosyltransferase family 4 protein [Acidimicrobiales bacterium]